MSTEPADEQLPSSQVRRPTSCPGGGTQEEPGPFSSELICPKCGGEVIRRHQYATFAVPECDWMQCLECDWKTDPE